MSQETFEKHMATMKQAKNIIAVELKRAQKMFAENPSSLNWVITTRAMLAHQQWVHLQVSRRSQELSTLLDHLDNIPLGEWCEAIVKAATGQTIAEVLA